MSNLNIPYQLGPSLERLKREGTLGTGAQRKEIKSTDTMPTLVKDQDEFTRVTSQDQSDRDSDTRPGFVQLPATQQGYPAKSVRFEGAKDNPQSAVIEEQLDGVTSVAVMDTSSDDQGRRTQIFIHAVSGVGADWISAARFDFGPGYTDAKGYTELLSTPWHRAE